MRGGSVAGAGLFCLILVVSAGALFRAGPAPVTGGPSGCDVVAHDCGTPAGSGTGAHSSGTPAPLSCLHDIRCSGGVALGGAAMVIVAVLGGAVAAAPPRRNFVIPVRPVAVIDRLAAGRLFRPPRTLSFS